MVGDFPQVFSDLDKHFAGFMVKLAGRDSSELHLAAALVSSRTRAGHVCLNLSSLAGTRVTADGCVAPSLNDWTRALHGSSVVGRPGDFKPLILDDRSRLYLYRYWDYERKLIDFIRKRTEDTQKTGACDIPRLREGIAHLFPAWGPNADWQKIAAAVTLLRPFVVISGSPGTGKTSTVTKIIALLLGGTPSGRLRIALAAPTGKAAIKLQEALRRGKETLDVPDAVKGAMPDEASTIHRLLGAVKGSTFFRHNERNPLPVDALIVDEASMIDLPLMSKLVQAVPDSARFILLGDKDQLSSVEAGAVLGDICGQGEINTFSPGFREKLREILGADVPGTPDGKQVTGIGDSIVHLQDNYRFRLEGGISRISAAVNRGDGPGALALMKSDACRDIRWVPLPEVPALPSALRDTVIEHFTYYMQLIESHGDFRDVIAALETFRILCALREGPYGTKAVNGVVERILGERKLIRSDTLWYHGRPIIITKNDYNLGLFNGDLGVIIHDGQSKRPCAYFADVNGAPRRFAPLRLPGHETVFAMTIHKSQGSEFDHVLLLLPDRDSPVLSRELIYTGITRARESAHVWGREEVFREAVSRRVIRDSGLRDALWESADS